MTQEQAGAYGAEKELNFREIRKFRSIWLPRVGFQGYVEGLIDGRAEVGGFAALLKMGDGLVPLFAGSGGQPPARSSGAQSPQSSRHDTERRKPEKGRGIGCWRILECLGRERDSLLIWQTEEIRLRKRNSEQIEIWRQQITIDLLVWPHFTHVLTSINYLFIFFVILIYLILARLNISPFFW